MVQKVEPFLQGKWGWDLGENNWKDGADENFLKFSYMLNSNIEGFVATLPVSPLDGTAYHLSTDNSLNARIDGVWYKFPIPKGFVITEKASGLKYENNGSAFVATLNSADKTKLNGIAAGATVNASDASLRDRATHTGTQPTSSVTGLDATIALKANLASPTFTGVPAAPTASAGTNTTQVATTAYVQGELGTKANLASPTFTGVPAAPTASAGTNTTQVATTAYVQGELGTKANLASPTFTGVPAAPTASAGTNTTQVATTAYVKSQNYITVAEAPVTSVASKTGVVTLVKADVGLANVDNTTDLNKPVSTATQTALNLKANIASPTFTGTVTLPSTTSIGPVTSTELGFVDGVTSSIQAQLDGKSSTSHTHPNATTSVPGFMSETDKTKLNGIAAGATVNASDSALRDRATHTGTQTTSTISDFTTTTDARISAAVGVTIQPLDGDLTAIGNLAGTSGLARKTAVNTWTLDTASYLTGNQSISIVGDATGSGTTSIGLTLANDVVTNAKLANVPTSTFKARSTAGTGDPEDLSIAQTKTLLNYIPSDIGAAPASHTQSLSTITDVTISASNLNILDDGGDTALHFHSSDRNRGNHTGTQSVSTITGLASIATSASASDLTLGTLSEARLPFQPVQQGGGIGQTTNKVYLGWSGVGKPKLTIDGTDLGNVALESFTTNASNLSSGVVSDSLLPGTQTGKTFTSNVNITSGGATVTGNVSLNGNLTATGSNSVEGRFIRGRAPDSTQSGLVGAFSNGGLQSVYLQYTGSTDVGLLLFEQCGTATIDVASGGAKLNLSVNGVTIVSLENDTAHFNKRITQQLEAKGNISGAVSIFGFNGHHITATSTGNTTWTFSSSIASTAAMSFTLELTNGGAFTQTWPAGTRWTGGVAPTLTASGTDILVFTKAGSANWRGYVASLDNK